MAMSSLRPPAARDSAGVDAALLVLRVVLGLLILLHGVSKLPPPPEFLVSALAQADNDSNRVIIAQSPLVNFLCVPSCFC